MLERGDERFLETLLSHAEQRGVTEPSFKPSELVKQINVQKLYNPDRVRRRDLAASGDAFKLFRELQQKVHLPASPHLV